MREGRRGGLPDHISDELQAFYLLAEPDAGVSSSWDALVAISQGGLGGAPDPDRKMVHRLEKKSRAIRHGALVATALRALPARTEGLAPWSSVLFAAYGGIPWARRLDEGDSRGMAKKVGERVGWDLLGVALLTSALAKLELPAEATRHVPADGPALTDPERLLIMACLGKSDSLTTIKAEAKRLLADARGRYADARAATDPAYTYLRMREEQRGQARPTRPPRVASLVGSR